MDFAYWWSCIGNGLPCSLRSRLVLAPASRPDLDPFVILSTLLVRKLCLLFLVFCPDSELNKRPLFYVVPSSQSLVLKNRERACFRITELVVPIFSHGPEG